MPVKKTGKLYLNYYRKQQFIVGLPFSISITKASYATNVHQTLRGFTPKPLLKDEFLAGKITWDEYISRYVRETVKSNAFWSDFEKVKALLCAGQDVTVFCHCESLQCHRFLVGDVFLLQGFQVMSMPLGSPTAWQPYKSPLYLIVD